MVQRRAEVGMGERVVGVDLDQGAVQRERLLVALLGEPGHGKMIECLAVTRIVPHGAREVLRRLRPAELLRGAAQKNVQRGTRDQHVGQQSQGPLQRFDRFRVALPLKQRDAQPGMGGSEFGVDSERRSVVRDRVLVPLL